MDWGTLVISKMHNLLYSEKTLIFDMLKIKRKKIKL